MSKHNTLGCFLRLLKDSLKTASRLLKGSDKAHSRWLEDNLKTSKLYSDCSIYLWGHLGYHILQILQRHDWVVSLISSWSSHQNTWQVWTSIRKINSGVDINDIMTTSNLLQDSLQCILKTTARLPQDHIPNILKAFEVFLKVLQVVLCLWRIELFFKVSAISTIFKILFFSQMFFNPHNMKISGS